MSHRQIPGAGGSAGGEGRGTAGATNGDCGTAGRGGDAGGEAGGNAGAVAGEGVVMNIGETAGV